MKNIKKLLSLLLCGIMLFGMFPASLFAADGGTGDGSGTISETFVPEITWKRTFEYEHRHDTAANQHTDLGGLYAGDKTDYLTTTTPDPNNTTDYLNKVQWDWADFSKHFNGRTDDVDDSAHKVWDYGHTDVQYADPVKASITNPIDSTSTIGGVGIIPYAPSAGEQAIFAATWNNRAAQDFKASSVDGTGIYSSGNYVSVKKGQMDIGYGKKSNDSTISTFSGKSYTARRFSGSFVWPAGYTLSDSIELISKNDSYYQKIYDAIEANADLKAAFGGKKVVAINDDMFVFVYKDGDQPTKDNYRDYLAFFAGTAGKGVWSWPNADPQNWGGEWNVTEPATYGDKYASKAFYKVFPNLDTEHKDRSNSMLPETLIGKEATSTTAATAGMMALSDYWYSFMDGNAISTVLNNKYGTTGINVGDTVHIDIYCIDMDKVGGIFFDWGGNSSVVENFVRNYRSVADKLIEVMEYYGFDGYFFNEETAVDYTTAGNLRSMIAYMRQQKPNMLIGWYDSITDSGNLSYQDAVNGSNSGWVSAGVNEFFMNYNWTTQDVNTTVSTMQNLGKSQYEAFAGLDVQQNCMNTYFSSNYLLNNSNKLKLSLALYCPNSTMGLSGDGADFHEVERQFYVNGGDPRSTSSSGWAGMSRFFADHTTIVSAPFVTNFNSGHGKAFYIDGVKSRDAEWSYQSVQDVMPTWTWIIDSNGQKLSGAYDFEDAYNGGSSIKFYGSLTANKPNNIMLYSTNLDINGSTNIAVTAKNDRGLMKLVAYYGDSSTSSYANCQKATFALDASSGGWTTSNVSLASLSGKKLYAIGFEIGGTSNVSDYQVNIGRLAVTDSEAAAASASNARLEEIIYLDAYTAEARIKWNGNNASSYEIYRLNADGTRTLIMETPNTAYYIPNLVRNDDQADVTVEVVPVNANGVRGESSRFTIDWLYENGDTEKLSDVTVPVNICPLAEVTGYSAQNDGEPAWKAIDGTSENGSKWCATNKQSGWMTIKLDQPRTIKRIRIEHAQYGGEAQNMNTIAFSVQYKSGNNWVTVYSTNNNSSAVTDELITPVTAQEWRLYISNSGSSAWGAIRIYEWQMFETTERNRTDIVLMKFASAKNNKGASDTFSLTHAPTGSTVRLYLRDANGNYTQIASKEAHSSTVSFTGLDYGSDAGRVFYTVQEGKQEESIKLSTAFDAEPGAVKYSINVVQPANGSVAASATSATAGTTIELTATPAEGYTLDYFTLDGERINGDTFIMPARNVDVSAVFTANAYSITVVQPTGGTVSASATSATAGTTVKLTANPAEGYTLDYFTLDGARINGDTFIMPARNVEVSAVFTANAYSITVVQPTGGTVSASKLSAFFGEAVELTAVPDEGYELSHYVVNGAANNGGTFTMPARDVIVTAVFTKVAEPSVNLALNATIYYSNKKYPDYAKNGPQHAFDGKMSDREADKWHASGINGWVAFDIHTPVANPILKIYHAGSAGEDSNLNTSSWDVYILNERYLTEEAYFNMDRSTQNRVCQIAWFWKRIHVTTGNTADISIDHIDIPEARRLFKINMRKTNQTGYPYHLNVYEIEMYAGN